MKQSDTYADTHTFQSRQGWQEGFEFIRLRDQLACLRVDVGLGGRGLKLDIPPIAALAF